MEPLRIYTLGGIRVLQGDEPGKGLEMRKAEALLVYLACSRREHSREVLADLLWDERSQRQALSNLRVALASLRKRLEPYLTITRETIALNPEAPVWTDVAEFEARLQGTRSGGSNRARITSVAGDADAAKPGPSEGDAREIKRAVELYQGEFLRGFYLRESRGFEAWLVQERERLHRLAISALHDLVGYALKSGAYQAGMAHATRLLALDPFNELAYQQMIQLLAYSGRRSEALAQYETCRRVLWEEFGVEPAAETKALVGKIRSGELELPAAAGAPPSDETTLQAANPYKGLRAFQEADAADFFGREALTERLVARLGEAGEAARFLAVVGPSGSGKSSLVKAGLIPALRDGALPGSEKWHIMEMIPGSHPFDELEIGLLRVAMHASPSLKEPLRRDERGLLRAARLALPSDRSELLLVIDQFEEVFTLVDDKAEARQFLESLYTAVTDPRSPVRVVITLRADFFDRPLLNPDLSRLVQDRTEVVIPLAVDELERAIRAPAERVGVTVEPGLVTAIIADMVEQPGALPLFQYALTELFEQRSKDRLALEGYQAIGGVQGVLERRAEETFAGLSATGQAAARQMFLRLVTLGEGVEDTRRRVLLSELEAVTLKALPPSLDFTSQVSERATVHTAAYAGAFFEAMEAFGKARLLSFDRDPLTRSPTVEITHEALLREWHRLREWLDESRADLRLQRALGNAAAEWLRAGRDPSFLLHGARLSQFESWAEETDLGLTGEERAYLEASLAEREAQRIAEEARKQREAFIERRARNFLRILVVVLLLATAGSLFLTGLARLAQTLATSRELAVQAINKLDTDPELSILLSLQALRTAYTREAEDALHRAVQDSRVRMTLTGHADGARTVEFSPDGKTIATASYAGEVTVWEVVSGQKLFSLPGIIARYSPDGARLVTGSEDGTITIWDSATRDQLWTASGHRKWISEARFSPKGRLLVTSSLDDTFIVRDAETGQEIFSSSASFSGFDALYNVAFSPDGSLLFAADFAGDISADPAGTVRVWRVGGDWPLLNEYPSNVMQFYFSPQGGWLAAPGGTLLEGIFLQDISMLPGAKLAATALSDVEPLTVPAAHASVIQDFAFSPDDSLLSTASQDGTTKIWRLSPDGADLLMTLSGHTAQVDDVIFSPDGAYVATASRDGTVRIWDITPSGASEWFALAGHTDMAYRFVLTPDGKYLATASRDGTAKVWDLESGKELFAVTGHGSSLFGVDISVDGSLLATAGYDNTAKIWKLNLSPGAASAELLRTISGHADAPAVGALFPGITSVAFNPDATKLATGGADGMAIVWEVKTGRKLFSVQAHPDRNGITRLIFSPDGKYLATATDEPSPLAKIWDATSGEEISTFSGHSQTNQLFGMAFSPDGERVVTAGREGVKIWDARTGQLLRNLTDQVAGPGVTFSPDGKYLATTNLSLDFSARIWDASSGEELRLYTSPSGGGLFEVAFSPDGKYLIASGADAVYGFVIDTEELIRLAYSRLTRWFTPDECRQYLHMEACPAAPEK